MYIYHALINALGARIIHINLNTIFYTHVEDSPTKSYCQAKPPPPPSTPSRFMYELCLLVMSQLESSGVSCVRVEVAVLDSASSIVRTVSVDVKQH